MVTRGEHIGVNMYLYNVGKDGRITWTYKGKRVPKSQVPLAEKRKATKEIEIMGEITATGCILCNNPGEMTRVYNGTVYDLCEECYYNKTLGELAEKVRKINGR